MTVNHKHKGAYAELGACRWLLEQGYEVFRNISQSGLIDIIALKDGNFLKIDVKTIKNGSKYRLPPKQITEGVAILYARPSGIYDLELAPLPRERIEICVQCKKAFAPNNWRQRLCSYGCRLVYASNRQLNRRPGATQ